MSEKDFENTKTGKLIWDTQGLYYRFEPNDLPLEFSVKSEVQNLIIETSMNLGRLDGIANKFSKEEADLIITPFVIKEAQLSSEIEGTQSTLDDVYRGEVEKETNVEKALDNEEIRNYEKTIKLGINKIRNGEKLNEDFIKELHRELLKGVRGKDKDPGEYKRFQNAIGKRNDTIETAKFIPASPGTTPFLMKKMFDFLENNKEINPLFKIALVHYQFEAIHPFRDGNGRLGRLLIILYLLKEGILKQPLLYMSEYFNKNRDSYVERLFLVSSNSEVDNWLEFFLNALNTQSQRALEFAVKLDCYKKILHNQLKLSTKSIKIFAVIDMLFKNPFITINDIKENTNITYKSAQNLMSILEDEKIVEEITGKERNKVYLAKEILKILKI